MKQAKHNITIKQNTENKIVIGLDDCGIDAVITFDSKFNYKHQKISPMLNVI